jgi:hypothetical protein
MFEMQCQDRKVIDENALLLKTYEKRLQLVEGIFEGH